MNDEYDEETLECNFCTDYFCVSKFGGICTDHQLELFNEDTN